MRQSVVLLLTLLAIACATTVTDTPPAPPEPAPVAAATPPCRPGDALLHATLWMQSSAEYDAAATQTYASARKMLDAALADPTWFGAEEDANNDPSQPPAVILDADETILDNSAYEARVVKAGVTYDAATWKAWVDEAGGRAVPGAAEFLAYAKSRGVTAFYITNRDHPEETEGTRRNLEKLGFPFESNIETLLLRGARPEWKVSDKSPRRAHVAASYRVLLVIGDDLNDFTNARDKSVAERDAIIERTKSWWGSRWFILPNPAYGSWERAITGGGGAPCEQFEKKMKALRE